MTASTVFKVAMYVSLSCCTVVYHFLHFSLHELMPVCKLLSNSGSTGPQCTVSSPCIVVWGQMCTFSSMDKNDSYSSLCIVSATICFSSKLETVCFKAPLCWFSLREIHVHSGFILTWTYIYCCNWFNSLKNSQGCIVLNHNVTRDLFHWVQQLAPSSFFPCLIFSQQSFTNFQTLWPRCQWIWLK